MLEQHIHQGDDRPGLAGTGGHNQQSLPAVLGQGLTGGLDSPLLVIAARNVAVNLDVFEACPHGPEVEELLQIPLGVDGSHLPLRVSSIVDAGVKAVGEEDHRTAAIFLLQQVCVQFGLLAALGRIHAGALSLDESQWAVGVVVEHIIGIAHLTLVGHAGQLHFVDPILPLRPASVREHGVDVELAGLVLGEVQGLGGVAGLLDLPAGGELGFEGLVFRHEGGKIHVGNGCGGQGGVLLLQQFRVKGTGGICSTVTTGDKVHEVPEVFQA